MTQQQLIARWRHEADIAEPRAEALVLRLCAKQLEAALSAGAVPQQEPQEPPSVACPVCGIIVQQVASATLSLALWQHWNWVCDRREVAVPALPAPQERPYANLKGSLRGDETDAEFDAAVQAQQQPECVWTLTEDEDVWSTTCGRHWQFIDGGPSDNHAFFCHNCGKKIVAKIPNENAILHTQDRTR